MSYDGWKEESTYTSSIQKHVRMLARRSELEKLIQEKYPEVLEYLQLLQALEKF